MSSKDFLGGCKSFSDIIGVGRSRALTFLLVEGRQDAVVPAHLEVNLLLHALGDGALGNDDADARLDGAQDPSVAVEDATGGGDHCVPFVLIVVVQGAGAEADKS